MGDRDTQPPPRIIPYDELTSYPPVIQMDYVTRKYINKLGRIAQQTAEATSRYSHIMEGCPVEYQYISDEILRTQNEIGVFNVRLLREYMEQFMIPSLVDEIITHTMISYVPRTDVPHYEN